MMRFPRKFISCTPHLEYRRWFPSRLWRRPPFCLEYESDSWRGARVRRGAAWVVGVTLAIAWVFRPLGPRETWAPGPSVLNFVATLQKASGLPVQANRTYAEQTMRWLEWYIGPVALGLAIAGMCILVLRSIRGGSGAAAILLFELGGVTALYLWNPNVVPDQVSRRGDS